MSTVIRDVRVRPPVYELSEKDVTAKSSSVRPERISTDQVDGEVGRRRSRQPGGRKAESAEDSGRHARTVVGQLRLGLSCQRGAGTPARITGKEAKI